MRKIQIVLWILVALVAFGVVSMVMYNSASKLINDKNVVSQLSGIGGPFTLVDSSGNQFTEENIIGKPTILFFGFTHCPDICPTTLAETQNWINQLGEDADSLNFLFVTVDPERDTAEVMRDYVSSFDERIIPLTGTNQQVDEMLNTYRVFAQKVETDDGDYTMDHTASVYLMDSNNHFVGTISFGEDPKVVIEKLLNLIQKNLT